MSSTARLVVQGELRTKRKSFPNPNEQPDVEDDEFITVGGLTRFTTGELQVDGQAFIENTLLIGAGARLIAAGGVNVSGKLTGGSTGDGDVLANVNVSGELEHLTVTGNATLTGGILDTVTINGDVTTVVTSGSNNTIYASDVGGTVVTSGGTDLYGVSTFGSLLEVTGGTTTVRRRASVTVGKVLVTGGILIQERGGGGSTGRILAQEIEVVNAAVKLASFSGNVVLNGAEVEVGTGGLTFIMGEIRVRPGPGSLMSHWPESPDSGVEADEIKVEEGAALGIANSGTVMAGTLNPHFPNELPDFGMKFAPAS